MINGILVKGSTKKLFDLCFSSFYRLTLDKSAMDRDNGTRVHNGRCSSSIATRWFREKLGD
jgi:hypothetical protein